MKAVAWIGMAILIVLTIATMAALIVLAIPDMWRDLRAHWRKGRRLARDHAPDRPGEPDLLDALDALDCDVCRPGGDPSALCTCTSVCLHVPDCVGDYTIVTGIRISLADVLWLDRVGIKGDE